MAETWDATETSLQWILHRETTWCSNKATRWQIQVKSQQIITSKKKLSQGIVPESKDLEYHQSILRGPTTIIISLILQATLVYLKRYSKMSTLGWWVRRFKHIVQVGPWHSIIVHIYTYTYTYNIVSFEMIHTWFHIVTLHVRTYIYISIHMFPYIPFRSFQSMCTFSYIQIHAYRSYTQFIHFIINNQQRRHQPTTKIATNCYVWPYGSTTCLKIKCTHVRSHTRAHTHTQSQWYSIVWNKSIITFQG